MSNDASAMGPTKSLASLPEMRFPDFSDGRGWQTLPLSKVLRPVSREVAKPATHYTGLGLRSHGKGTFQKPDQDPSKIAMDHLYVVRAGDLIVNITFAWEGAIAVAGYDDEGCLVSHRFPTYELKPNVSTPDFFRYVIARKAFVYELGVISPGGAGRNRVMNKRDFLRLSVSVPSLDEQKMIVGCLSSIDNLIGCEAAKLEALKDYKSALLQKFLPGEGKLGPECRFPQYRASGNWQNSSLAKLFRSLDAGVSVRSGDRAAYENEEGILKTSCVSNGIFDASENKVVDDPEQVTRLKEPVTQDTIIISRMNTPELVGANAYVKNSQTNIYLPDRLWAAKGRKNVCMRYIAQHLGSNLGRSSISQLATGSSNSMKNISKSSILGLTISIPTSGEQQKIADFLSTLDEKTDLQRERVRLLKNHKRGLLQRLFP